MGKPLRIKLLTFIFSICLMLICGTALAVDETAAPVDLGSIGDIVDIPDEPVPIQPAPAQDTQLPCASRLQDAASSAAPSAEAALPSPAQAPMEKAQEKPAAASLDALLDKSEGFTVGEDTVIDDSDIPMSALPQEKDITTGFGLYAVLAAAGIFIVGLSVLITRKEK